MAWVRIDDQVGRHQKFLAAGPAASWLWVLGLAYCQSQLTDGFISDQVLPMIGIPRGAKPLADRLVVAGLFERVESGYLVHDYLDFNESRDAALARKAEVHTARVEAGRRGGVSKASKRLATAKQTSSNLRKQTPSPIPSHPNPKDQNLSAAARQPRPRGGNGKTDADEPDKPSVQAFLRRFCEHYAKALHGAKYLVKPAKDVPLLRQLLAAHGAERLEQLAVVMLHADDKFIAESDRGIQILSTKINWLESRLRAAEATT